MKPLSNGVRALILTVMAAVLAQAAEVAVTDTGYLPIKRKDKPTVFVRDIVFRTGAAVYGFRQYGDAIGMSGPSPANFYNSMFFLVRMGKDTYFSKVFVPTKEQLDKMSKPVIKREGGAAELVWTQERAAGAVTLRLKALPDADGLRMTVAVAPKDKAATPRVDFYMYPGGYIRKTGHKVITFNSGRVLEAVQGKSALGSSKAQPDEFWLYACDKNRGAGPETKTGGCGIEWRPDGIASCIVRGGGYAVLPQFTLKPGVKEAHFVLYDLAKHPNAKGLERMKTLVLPPPPAK